MRKMIVSMVAVVMAAVVSACSLEPGVTTTWRGSVIRVLASEPIAVNAGTNEAEVEVGSHKILLTEGHLVLNGERRSVPRFSRLIVRLSGGTLTIEADGRRIV